MERGEELVDPHVRRAVEADPAAGVREAGRPPDQSRAVLALDRVEDPPRALRIAGAADVGNDVDVAALDQVRDRPDLARDARRA